MADVTQILSRIEAGDSAAAAQLMPLVYEELKRLASHRMAQERPGQTLQATALVHEAYLRLVDPKDHEWQQWDGRGHFFAAAAEAKGGAPKETAIVLGITLNNVVALIVATLLFAAPLIRHIRRA